LQCVCVRPSRLPSHGSWAPLAPVLGGLFGFGWPLACRVTVPPDLSPFPFFTGAGPWPFVGWARKVCDLCFLIHIQPLGTLVTHPVSGAISTQCPVPAAPVVPTPLPYTLQGGSVSNVPAHLGKFCSLHCALYAPEDEVAVTNTPFNDAHSPFPSGVPECTFVIYYKAWAMYISYISSFATGAFSSVVERPLRMQKA
jgi:hypothetical protein